MSTRRRPALGTVDLGDLGQPEPIGRAFGGDRGTPLDRYYIEDFLDRHRDDIRGRVGEIGEAVYTRRFGGPAVAVSEVIDVPRSDNPAATILIDLQRGRAVEAGSFDCLILTQTLHMIYDVRGAIRTVHRMLAPGGVVLATVPGITPIDVHDGPEKWFWAMTQSAARRLFQDRFGREAVSTRNYGNVLAATAFLQGLAFEEVDRDALDVVDPLFPVITGVRAVKT